MFFAYLIYEACQEFVLYAMDVAPSVGWKTFWWTFCATLIVEGALKFAVIGELFGHLLRSWKALGKLGSRTVSAGGALLVLIATIVAALAPVENPEHIIISRAHILQESLYIIECGLILLTFAFAAHFRLSWGRESFGILVGFGLLSCEHMASWGIVANGLLSSNRDLLDFLNMATYHLCVLIWCYYLLVPAKVRTPRSIALPEHNLEVWNRELERLLQQ